MSQPNAVASFFGGGGKGITWPDQPPKTVSGVITMVHPPEPQRDPKTGLPTDKMQIRIELETAERSPEIEFDDGARTLYVKSYMRSAIGDALKKVGEKEPKIGGTLTVAFVRLEPPERPGLNPGKIYEAVYQPPAVTGDFFNGGQGQAPQAAVQQYPNGMSPTGAPLPPQYAAPPQPQYVAPQPQQPVQQQMPVAPQQQPQPQYVAAGAPTPAPAGAPGQPGFAQGPQAAPGIPKPDSISAEAWAAMDENTRRTVASAVGTPQF